MSAFIIVHDQSSRAWPLAVSEIAGWHPWDLMPWGDGRVEPKSQVRLRGGLDIACVETCDQITAAILATGTVIVDAALTQPPDTPAETETRP